MLEQVGGRRLYSTHTLTLYHLCREAVAYNLEGDVLADHIEDGLKRLLQ